MLLHHYEGTNAKARCAGCKNFFDWGDLQALLRTLPSGFDVEKACEAEKKTEWLCMLCVSPDALKAGADSPPYSDESFKTSLTLVAEQTLVSEQARELFSSLMMQLLDGNSGETMRTELAKQKIAKPSRAKKARNAVFALLAVHRLGGVPAMSQIPKDVMKIIGNLVLDSASDSIWDQKRPQLAAPPPPPQKKKKKRNTTRAK